MDPSLVRTNAWVPAFRKAFVTTLFSAESQTPSSLGGT